MASQVLQRAVVNLSQYLTAPKKVQYLRCAHPVFLAACDKYASGNGISLTAGTWVKVNGVGFRFQRQVGQLVFGGIINKMHSDYYVCPPHRHLGISQASTCGTQHPYRAFPFRIAFPGYDSSNQTGVFPDEDVCHQKGGCCLFLAWPQTFA